MSRGVAGPRYGFCELPTTKTFGMAVSMPCWGEAGGARISSRPRAQPSTLLCGRAGHIHLHIGPRWAEVGGDRGPEDRAIAPRPRQWPEATCCSSTGDAPIPGPRRGDRGDAGGNMAAHSFADEACEEVEDSTAPSHVFPSRRGLGRSGKAGSDSAGLCPDVFVARNGAAFVLRACGFRGAPSALVLQCNFSAVGCLSFSGELFRTLHGTQELVGLSAVPGLSRDIFSVSRRAIFDTDGGGKGASGIMV